MPESKLLSFILFLSVLFGAGYLVGQNLDYRFAAIDAGQGLRANGNDFIYKDSRGYFWFSSINGLYRFNGVELRVFTADDDNGLIDNNIQSDFFEDSVGNIWFTTNQGVNRYNRASGDFSHFWLKDSLEQKVENAYCLIHLQQDSLLWIRVGQTLYRFNPFANASKWTELCKTRGARFLVQADAKGQPRQIIAAPWLSTSGFEIITLSEEGELEKETFLEGSATLISDSALVVKSPIAVLDSTIWLCTGQGLLKFDQGEPTQSRLFSSYEGKKVDIKKGIFLPPKYLLLNSRELGLLTFDLSNEIFVKQQVNSILPYGLRSNNPRGIYLDPQENLWISHQGTACLNYAWTEQEQFGKWSLPNSQKIIDPVSSLTEDMEGHIWCAFEDRGIFVFDNTGEKIWEDTVRWSKLYKVERDQKDHIWCLGTNELGRYIPQDGFRYEPIWRTSLELLDFCVISPDRVLATTNEGLRVLRIGKAGNIKVSEPELFSNRQLIALNIFSDNKRNFYLPTINNQLLKFHFTTKDTIQLEWKLPLESTFRSFWNQSDSSYLYVGTMEEVYKINVDSGVIQDRIFSNYPYQIPKNQVISIIGSGNQTLWLCSYEQLFRYDLTTDSLLYFGEKDDLEGIEFSPNARVQANNGSIWLGTSQGLVSFDPGTMSAYPHGPVVQFESILQDGKPYKSEIQASELSEIELNYYQNSFEVQVVGISAYAPEWNTLFYRLEPNEQRWQKIENGSIITYEDLPPGNYQLIVYALSANGVRGSDKVLNVQIPPPFWMTWWFWLLVLTGLGLVTYLSISYYVNQKLNKQKAEFERKQALQKALQDERNRIANEMHDDLGSGLTSIQLLLKRIKKGEVSLLERVENQSKQLIGNMSEIIWAMNSSYDNLDSLLAYIRLNVVQILDDNQIAYSFKPPREKLDTIEIRGKKRRNTYLVIKESVHNIIKHAEATEVQLDFQLKEGILYVKIKDNGKGIAEAAGRKFGNGLRNIRERMEEIQGRFTIYAEQGTIVELEIPIT